ncbi:hypothetical protein M0805_000998 [Coniferiporia weirii]|nr:hypothetical protein M0805_000998 [Coniferiporia weirii]
MESKADPSTDLASPSGAPHQNPDDCPASKAGTEANEKFGKSDTSSVETAGREEGEERRRETFWAWATVVSAFIIQSTTFGYANAFGVYQDYYVREFLPQSSSSQISWIGSTQAFLMLTMGLFTGRLFDRGYCYHLVVTGSVLLVFSLFMLSLAQPGKYYQVFLTQGLGVGLGSSLSYLPSIAIIAHHFPEPHARARAMGIAVAGSSLGGLIHPIMLNNLLHGSAGFARGVQASAGLIAGMQFVAVLLMRTKYPKKSEAEKWEEQNSKATNTFSIIKRFAKDWSYVSIVIGMTLMEMSFFFPSFYIQLDAIKRGLDSTFAFYSLSILNGVSLIGRLAPGFFSRSLGVANMFLVSAAGSTILVFCMLAVKSVAGVSAFACLYGLFSGAYVTLMGPMLAILSESPSEIGVRIGMCFAVTGLGSLTGTPISGALLSGSFVWWRPIVFNGSVCAGACVLFLACYITLRRRQGSTSKEAPV